MISVIIPVYNVEKYIKRCLESVINQTYKDIEIIIIDDGSTDNSGIICEEYSKRDKRIKVVHTENAGAARARNIGLDMAKGEYISFIDSDDWIMLNFLSTLLYLCKDNDADIAKCETIDVKDENFKINNNNTEIKIYNSKEIMNSIYSQPKLFNVAVMNKLYKRKIFENLRFKEGVINEDEEILCKLIYRANKIAVTNQILYCYFLSENSVTRSEFRIKNLDILEIFESRLKFLTDKGFHELYKQTEAQYLRIIGNFYYSISKSNWENKEKYLKDLLQKKDNIQKIKKSNKYFSIKDNIKLLLCFRFQFVLTVIYFFKNNFKKEGKIRK